ncbi:hypothetical protein JZ751_004625 [Albula glossodonta]|uniref:Uncharacterized protein n=1 Tax=Albula glossodonta TaxID=121402 RepID=A0A8T2N507_9TELE|nr:hypothetical protein JZ751_004625 [Albula glossodonta]
MTLKESEHGIAIPVARPASLPVVVSLPVPPGRLCLTCPHPEEFPRAPSVRLQKNRSDEVRLPPFLSHRENAGMVDFCSLSRIRLVTRAERNAAARTDRQTAHVKRHTRQGASLQLASFTPPNSDKKNGLDKGGIRARNKLRPCWSH